MPAKKRNDTEVSDQNTKSVTMFFDGAGCRPNGEGSAFAWLCKDSNQREIVRENCLTNNQAEYKGFLAALKHVPEDSTVEMFSDSQLICSQFAGQYRVKDYALQELLSQVLAVILNKRLKVNLQWVPRAQNLAGKLL